MTDIFVQTKIDILKKARLRLETELEAINSKISELEEEQSVLLEKQFDDALTALRKLGA